MIGDYPRTDVRKAGALRLRDRRSDHCQMRTSFTNWASGTRPSLSPSSRFLNRTPKSPSMCVIRVVVIHAGRRQNQRIDEKIKSLVKYIAGISDARATDSPIYQLLEVIQFTHTLSNEKVEMLHQQTDFNENLKSESKRSSTGRYRTPTKSRLFKPLRPSLAKKKI